MHPLPGNWVAIGRAVVYYMYMPELQGYVALALNAGTVADLVQTKGIIKQT